ncbi:MAG: peptide deformylase [Pseudomonadota bacterium]
MPIRKIARMGHPVLQLVAKPVDDPTAPAIAALAQDLIETCDDVGGNGIAAPQVYEPLRMFAYRVRTEIMPAGVTMREIPWTVCINPDIEFLGAERKLYWERCLSLPGLYGQVPRVTHIRFSWTDLTGARQTQIARGFHARLLQHEYDHLEGVLYPSRMIDLATLGFVSELGPAAYPPLPRDAEDFVDPETSA